MLWGSPKRGGLPFARHADDARQHARAGRAAPARPSACTMHVRHQALIDVSSYPAETEVPSFKRRVKCGKCGGKGNKIDVHPNWKEQPDVPMKLDYRFSSLVINGTSRKLKGC